MLSKIDRELNFVQNALDLRARRQEVLSSNIANADTPNYKARDLDFAAALKNALGPAAGPMTLSRTHQRHIEAQGGAEMDGLLQYRSTVQPSLDGNTVDMDVERAHFAENALHYQFLLDRAASQFKTLSMAISDK